MRGLPQVFLLSVVVAVSGCLGSGGGGHGKASPLAGAPASRSSTLPGEPESAAKKRKKAPAQPGSATLSWHPPTDYSDGSVMADLAGYRIYYGRSARKLDQVVTIDNPGLTRYVLENLAPARWHFAMTAISTNGRESERSGTVSKTIT